MADKPADAELTDIDQIEMSLTVAPAVQEDFLMTKSEKDKAARIEAAKADVEAAQAALKKAEDDEEEEEEEDPKPDPKDNEDEDEESNFNFEKIGDEAKEVISAIGKALMGLVDGGQAEGLPEGVQDFAKAAAALAPISKSAKTEEDRVIAVVKSVLGEGAVAAIQAPVRAELKTLTDKVTDMEEEKDLEDMKKTAAELPGGDTPEGALAVAKQLTMIKKSMSAKDFEAYVEGQKGLKTQIEKSELFEKRSSSRATPVEGSAEARIYAKAETMVKKGEGGVKTLPEAIEAVSQADPDLWTEYQEETRARVRVQGGN